MFKKIIHDLAQLADPEQAEVLRGFFKTGPGQYGEGDVFRGIKVPVLRQIVKKYPGLPLADAEKLLHAPHHEDRMLGLLFLVAAFEKGGPELRRRIYRLYLANTRFINNWDLVDATAPHIVGAYLFDRNRAPLRRLALSGLLWERRIAIVATFYCIRRGQFEDTLELAAMLLDDKHDLIHKAVGWMLREVGKRDREAEEIFLRVHCSRMPRTMLRYAIERFPREKRQLYLGGLSAARQRKAVLS
ncbi:MAG: DNA alkylation repair protein [Deltaproteobacteria bacterium]|nr:DNA alkylation repair protein [Deltaproteobacteria bacterium]